MSDEFDVTAEQVESDEDDLRTGLAGLAGLVANALSVSEMLSAVAGFAARAIPASTGWVSPCCTSPTGCCAFGRGR